MSKRRKEKLVNKRTNKLKNQNERKIQMAVKKISQVIKKECVSEIDEIKFINFKNKLKTLLIKYEFADKIAINVTADFPVDVALERSGMVNYFPHANCTIIIDR